MERRSRTRGWGLAVASFLLATVVNVGLQRLTANIAPFLPYFPALIATALYAGRGPGLAGLGFATLACALFWLAPDGRPLHSMPLAHEIALAAFVAAGAITVELAHRMRSLRERAERLRIDQQADLEQHRATEAALRESETRLDLALRAAAMGTWELDVESDLARVSHRVREIFGADRSEAPLAYWTGRIDPEDQPGVAAQFAAARRGDAALDCEFRVRVDGALRWVRVSALLAGSGRPRRLVGLAEDVTARKAELEEMKHGREELQTMLDLLPVGVAISHDVDADRITVSPNLRCILRLAPEQNASYTGPGHEAIPYRCMRAGLEVAGADLPMQLASRTGRDVHDDEIDIMFADGEVRTLIISAAPLFDAQGKVRGAIGTHVDVTALKGAQRALEQADRQKDEFLATLAHELRNPMAPIRYATAMLRADVPAPLLAQARRTIERQSAQMARLLDDLLDMSRITRNVIELRRERHDLCALAHEALEAARPTTEAAGHRLSIAMPDGPLWVDGDATRLLQVIGNLLSNAAKYTPPGGRIDVQLGRDAGHALLRVRDTGIGLAPEMLPRVFELFSQVHPATKASKGGLGIGLAVVRRLVELHGGEIVARSDGIDRGAEFELRLPLAPAPAAAAPREAGGAAAGHDDAGHGCAPSAPQRVLVVDDNADAADSLAMLLRSQGAEVELAHDGPQALQHAARFRPAVVVLDVGLPGISGHEVARALRQQPGGAALRIIGVTGWGQAEDRRRTREAGFDLHLVKPVDPEQLLRVVAEGARPAAAAEPAATVTAID